MDEKEVLSWIRKARLERWDGLDLSKNHISTLPPEIGQLENLSVLDVSQTGLLEIPPEVGALKNLRILKVARNQLTILPKEISQLAKLISLDGSSNKLRSLPAGFGNLSDLQQLQLGVNGFTHFPDEIINLTGLTILELQENMLERVPAKISFLKKLHSLNLSLNYLVEIPSEIGELKNLEKVDLSNNKLTKLPLEVLTLAKIKQLDLRNNSLNIPPEILENIDEPQKILNYYSNIAGTELSENVDIEELSRNVFEGIKNLNDLKIHRRLQVQLGKPINEIKLVIVGQGSVGKTSLVQQILHGTFDQNQNKTEGISINQWHVDDRRLTVDHEKSSIVNGQSSIKLNIWDFGGQEIMHATHQFFLTKRSLYLLVLDARLTQEENRVEYWLKIIQSFGGESPVLIVGNKTDQHPLDIDRTGLQKKYPNIVGILETSAATGVGIAALKAEIAKQVDTLPHVRDLLPETWFTVKSKLEELGRDKNFITQDEYLGLCGANDVTDETSQHTLIGFLHDLGVVLHFQDDPRLEALGILNPQWVTNGVYKILNSHELFQSQGKLTLPLLNKILNLPEYPSNKRLFIVDMMKKFELCYDIEPDKEFLIPDLLPKDEPDGIEVKSVAAFQYQYPVLPSSVITRFIVRMNKYIANNIAWRTGVVLRIGNNRAIVKADIEDKKISIYMDGVEHTRRDALSAIRYQLDEIHDTIKGLNPQKRVPIPEAPNAEPLEYDYLLQLERDGFEEHPVKDGNRLVKINVRKLLSGIESETKRKENLGNVTNIYVGGSVGGNIVVGDENTIEITTAVFKSVYHAIDESARDATEKQDLIADMDEIKNEVTKGDDADESFLSRRLRNLKKMAPDIAEVALSALVGPGAAISAIVKNIARQIKEETI
jgi:internalin A